MTTTAARVRRGLEESIVAGRFQPGDQLDLDEICADFQCSRTPVREALQYLTDSGLVQVRPKRGTFVSRLTVHELTERFEVMAEFEGLCAALAATRMAPDASERMHAGLERCEHFYGTGDTDGYYDANSEFHRAIYAGSNNHFLEQQALRLQSGLEVYRRLQLRLGDRISRSLAEHRAIAQAIDAGDTETARRLARAHVAIQGEEFTELVLSQRGRALQ